VGFRLPLSGCRTKSRTERRKPEAASDSRTFSPKTTGIRLGSSQNVNGVLFSLACRRISTLYKYFVFSHLHSVAEGPKGVVAEAVEILWKVLAGPALSRSR
jgi:hypothetical protein